MSALAGRVVIVTRAEHQAAPLESLLQVEGATVYRYPCLAIAPPDQLGPLDDALRAAVAGKFDWLALTSVNAVESSLHALPCTRTRSPGSRSASFALPLRRNVVESVTLTVTCLP